MNKKIEKILKDIYLVDSSLREYERELIKIIEEYIKAKPDTKFDENFVRKLRSKLLRRVTVIKDERQAKSEKTSWLSGLFPVNKFTYALGGAAIALILVIPLVSYFERSGKQAVAPVINFGEGISKVADQAFGKIAVSESASGVQAEGRGAGGGGQLTAPSSEAKVGVPAPEFINFNYTYQGDEIVLDKEELDVFRRVKGEAGGKDLARYVSGLNFDLVDLSKLRNTNITNFNLVEDREFGYSLYLNLIDNSFSINKNWNKWPRVDKDCRDQACFDKFRLKIEDVPADDKLIAITSQFLKDYNIDISNYGQPMVQGFWRRQYEAAEDKTSVYIPEDIPIVYPLVLDSQTVYDTGGNPTGLHVSVDIRHNRASGVGNIVAHSYESSSYAAETDTNKIIAIAENGGLWPAYKHPNPTKTVEVELGTPTSALMIHYSYDNEKNETTELYVPALIFPITNISDNTTYWQRNNVIVPLIKEIIETIQDRIGIPEQPRVLLEAEGQAEEIEVKEAEAEVFPE